MRIGGHISIIPYMVHWSAHGPWDVPYMVLILRKRLIV